MIDFDKRYFNVSFLRNFDDNYKIITFFYNLEVRRLVFQYYKKLIALRYPNIFNLDRNQNTKGFLILNFIKSWNVWNTSLQIWLQHIQISIQSIFELCFASNRKTINCLRPSFKWLARFLFATEQNTMMKAHFSMICFSHK